MGNLCNHSEEVYSVFKRATPYFSSSNEGNLVNTAAAARLQKMINTLKEQENQFFKNFLQEDELSDSPEQNLITLNRKIEQINNSGFFHFFNATIPTRSTNEDSKSTKTKGDFSQLYSSMISKGKSLYDIQEEFVSLIYGCILKNKPEILKNNPKSLQQLINEYYQPEGNSSDGIIVERIQAWGGKKENTNKYITAQLFLSTKISFEPDGKKPYKISFVETDKKYPSLKSDIKTQFAKLMGLEGTQTFSSLDINDKIKYVEDVEAITLGCINDSKLREFMQKEFDFLKNAIKSGEELPYGIGMEVANLKGFLAEAGFNAMMKYLGAEGVKPGGMTKFIKNRKELSVDAFVGDTGFQIKNYSQDYPIEYKGSYGAGELFQGLIMNSDMYDFATALSYNLPIEKASIEYRREYNSHLELASNNVVNMIMYFLPEITRIYAQDINTQIDQQYSEYYNTFFYVNGRITTSSSILEGFLNSNGGSKSAIQIDKNKTSWILNTDGLPDYPNGSSGNYADSNKINFYVKMSTSKM